ncbi:MAG: hypothetical protein OER04_01970 [Cyclobacteriaceae bacterium]|nr:hypothetical protein [Cyclobacteriaceae bacterium]
MAGLTKIINKQLQARIQPVSEKVDLENIPMFAINWLDLNSKSLYNLYGFLAFPLARSIGAKAIFKGYQTELLKDSAKVNRAVLLIVKYPSPQAFLSLLGRKFFQVISLLRIKAVRNFNLGFAQLIQGKSGDKEDHYLVYHFQGGTLEAQLPTLQGLAQEQQCQLYFVAQKSATLTIINRGQERAVPLPMEGLVIFTQSDRQSLQRLADHPKMEELLSGNQSSYLSYFKRVI